MDGKKISNNLSFLSTFATIRNGHLSKKDVYAIKVSLGRKIGAASFLTAILLLAVNIVLFFIIGSEIKFDFTSKYGAYSLVGIIASFLGSVICIPCQLISFISEKDAVKNRLCRFGSMMLFIGASTYMIFSIHADSIAGYLTMESISAATLVTALLLIIQPVFWSEAIILDTVVSGSMIVIAVHGAIEHNVQSLYYYIIIAVGFLLISYLVVSILFYAESQNYFQVLRNERLYNKAMYDELTQCKNRHALRQFLKENQKRWENKSLNLLVIMFDIDNFKEYNDQFSHPGGDYCLRSVSDAIRREFQSPNLDFFRYGGEEFLLFLEIRDPEDARKIVLQVKNAVKELKIEAPEGAPKDMVTISVGAALVSCPTEFDFDATLADVDKNLYSAKKAGKDICCLNGQIVK